MARLRLDVREADGDLPMVCMRCGAPATVTRTRRMSWYPRWVWILILINLLVVIIVALILTKRATLQAPLCDQHKGHWSRRLLIGIVSFVLMLLFIIGDIVVMSNAPRHIQPPCRARPPTARELDSVGSIRVRFGVSSGGRRRSVAEESVALRARHSVWPERRRPCHWRRAAARLR